MISKKAILFSVFSIMFLFLGSSLVSADENSVKMYDGLDDDSYVLYIPNGAGFVQNKDGSTNFSAEQIAETGGIVMTVREAKVAALNYKPEEQVVPYSTFPSKNYSITISAGQSARESVSGAGWKHSRYYYNPAPGTGAYLLWTSHLDSGLVYDSSRVIRALEANTPTYVYSDVNRGTRLWGVAYKTYNAPAGTYITIANW